MRNTSRKTVSTPVLGGYFRKPPPDPLRPQITPSILCEVFVLNEKCVYLIIHYCTYCAQKLNLKQRREECLRATCPVSLNGVPSEGANTKSLDYKPSALPNVPQHRRLWKSTWLRILFTMVGDITVLQHCPLLFMAPLIHLLQRVTVRHIALFLAGLDCTHACIYLHKLF